MGDDANLEVSFKPASSRCLTADGVQVWTSTLQRTIQTGSYLNFQKKTWKSLDELDAGVCDGMTYEEIEVSLSDSDLGALLM